MSSVSEETRRDGWSDLDGSLRAVAVEVLRHGPLPRAELSRRLGLSPGSLTRLTRPLLDAGLLVEGGPELHARTGRPSVPLDVASRGERLAGVTITGREVYAVLTDLRATVLGSATATLPGTSVEEVVGAMAAAVGELTGGRPDVLGGVGVGIGGAVPDHRTVTRAPSLGWARPVPLAVLLSSATGAPVAVDNDVRALTAAEHWFGRGRGLHSFALVTVGAGIGTGLVLHDRQVCGSRGLAGAVAHVPVTGPGGATPFPGVRCEQGHTGCASAVLTTAALAGADRQPSAGPVCGRAGPGVPDEPTVTDAAAAALARMVALVVAFADPEAVLISGEGAGLLAAGRPAFDATLAATVGDDAPAPVELVPFGAPDWARGAAVVAIQERVLGHARTPTRRPP